MFDRMGKLAGWKPLPPGEPAPPLSLTADDGTWIKLPDFKNYLHVVLVFFHRMDDPETDRYLRALDAARPQLQELETAVFAVHTARTDQLRAYRGRLAVEVPMLYDPLALASRGFRASGRVVPLCRDTVVVVGKDGKVMHASRDRTDPAEIVAMLARAEGKDAPPPPPPPARPAGNENVRDPGRGPAPVQDIESAQAVRMLGEADTAYVLVDVRTKGEFDRERSPLAGFHIPIDELPHRYQEIGQTTHLIFVCQGGGRSAAAAEFMTSVGASHVYNVLGGMSQWSGPKVGSAHGGT